MECLQKGFLCSWTKQDVYEYAADFPVLCVKEFVVSGDLEAVTSLQDIAWRRRANGERG